MVYLTQEMVTSGEREENDLRRLDRGVDYISNV